MAQLCVVRQVSIVTEIETRERETPASICQQRIARFLAESQFYSLSERHEGELLYAAITAASGSRARPGRDGDSIAEVKKLSGSVFC